MIPLVIRLPLDPTGLNPDNLVAREPHVISTKRLRAIATKSGAFFSKSLILYDDTTGQQLTKDQYYAAEMYQLPTNQYGEEICAVIMITDPTVSTKVSVTYQALGGIFSTSQEAIIAQIERLQIDTRPVAWGDLIGKPDGFKPSAHLHDAGDIYGFEYVVFALERIRDAIALGDAASHDAIYRYVDNLEAVLRALIAQNANNFNAHVNNKENPHQVTAAQLNVFTKPETSNLIAQSIASLSAALNGRIDSEVTALVLADTQTNARISAHVSNTLNPHQTTAAQLSAWTSAETQAAINQAVATANNALNARITAEVAALNVNINAVAADVGNRFNGAYRGHVGVTTNGSAPNYTITPDAALKLWVESSWIMKVVFHAANSEQQTSLAIAGTGMSGHVRNFNSDGIEVNPKITAGMVSDVHWTGSSWILVDPLPPPPPKPAIGFYAQVPGLKVEDAICVPEIGIMDWKTVGPFTNYFTKDLGKLFYEIGPTRPWCVELNGTWLNKAQYRHLWAFAQASGMVVQAGSGFPVGSFVFTEINSDTFALPDLRNVFVRGYGTDDVGNGRSFGSLQGHQFGSHIHDTSTSSAGAHNHGTGWGESQTRDNRYGIYDYTRGVGSGKTDYDNFDNATSTNGVHGHFVTVMAAGGNETRPVNVAMSPRIQII